MTRFYYSSILLFAIVSDFHFYAFSVFAADRRVIPWTRLIDFYGFQEDGTVRRLVWWSGGQAGEEGGGGSTLLAGPRES